MTDARFQDLPADHPMNTLPATVFKANDFEPKLKFAQRCAILALNMRNVSVAQLAAAFEVNRRTINKIVQDNSTRYKAVRDELKRMGEREFVEHYVTEDIALKIAAAAAKPEVALSSDAYDASAAESSGQANPRATIRSGFNTVKEDRHDFSHRIEVSWLEANTAADDTGPFEHPAGWYWRDLDSDTPDYWRGDPENGHHLTSNKAFEHARRNA